MSTTTRSTFSATVRSTFWHVNTTQLCDQIIVFVFASALYAAVLYNTGTDSTALAGIAGAVVLVGAIVWGYLAKAEWRTTIATVVFVALVLWVFGYLREFSYDGLNYHIATPLILDRALNGVTAAREPGGIFWALHYPKAFEYFAYTAKVLTGHFNSGKSFTLLLSVPALFALMRLFQTAGISGRTSLIAAAASVYNPVAIGQVTSFYIDAAHYYCWAIFSINLLFAIKRLPYSKAQLGCALVLLIASKLTGPVFAALTIFVFVAVDFVTGERSNLIRRYRGIVAQLAIWSFVAVAIVGYSPYVQNVVAGENVLYPVLGKDKVDVMGGKASAHFLGLNPVHKLLLSYFSLPSNCSSCDDAEPVFAPTKARMRDAFIALHTTDTRFAGFGPFFGVMLIACLASFFWRRQNAEIVKIYLLATMVLVLTHPQSWWARYVPMFYVVPCLVIAGFSSSRRLFQVVVALGIANSTIAVASVGGYLFLKDGHYNKAVASVRAMCGNRAIELPPSEMNWEADLRDDGLAVATKSDPANPGCPVNFDEMMVMKK
jgi:hypothetical protein